MGTILQRSRAHNRTLPACAPRVAQNERTAGRSSHTLCPSSHAAGSFGHTAGPSSHSELSSSHTAGSFSRTSILSSRIGISSSRMAGTFNHTALSSSHTELSPSRTQLLLQKAKNRVHRTFPVSFDLKTALFELGQRLGRNPTTTRNSGRKRSEHHETSHVGLRPSVGR